MLVYGSLRAIRFELGNHATPAGPGARSRFMARLLAAQTRPRGFYPPGTPAVVQFARRSDSMRDDVLVTSASGRLRSRRIGTASRSRVRGQARQGAARPGRQ